MMKTKTVFLVMLICIIYCQKELPHHPSYENSFDPNNPLTHGDPFQLEATLLKSGVSLTWHPMELSAIEGYNLYRSVDHTDSFKIIASTDAADSTWLDSEIAKGHRYWYKIAAYDKSSTESDLSNIQAAWIDTEPIFYINGDDSVAYSAIVELTIFAPAAMYMWISNNSDFSDGHWETYASFKTWELLNTDGLHVVFIKFKYSDGYVTKMFSDSIWLDLTNPPMIYVPAGEFAMGSNTGVGDSDERPLHSVTVDGFWIDTYEVTNSHYASFLSEGNGDHYRSTMKIKDNGNGNFSPEPGSENHPVVNVTHADASAYAAWRGCLLPTEAQWEKAATGVAKRTYPWGELMEKNRANYWESGDPFEVTLPYTTPVGYYDGSIQAGYQTKDNSSSYGVYDMAGNVWEWCSDWYHKDYYQNSPGSNPTGPESGSYKVIRGGSWSDEPYYCRTATRSYRLPAEARGYIGFRCVKN